MQDGEQHLRFVHASPASAPWIASGGMIDHCVRREVPRGVCAQGTFSKIDVLHVRKTKTFVESTERAERLAAHGEIARPPVTAGIVYRGVLPRRVQPFAADGAPFDNADARACLGNGA